MFNEITVSIDASATGYNVETAEGKLKTINGKSRLNYNALGVVRSVLDLEKQLTFTTGGAVATSAPVVVNLGSGEKLLYISKLKIGPLEVSSTTEAGSITLPDNIVISPKTKYLVKLTIVPSDGYVANYGNFGFDAVRINGHVWMRHNVGVANSVDPDVLGRQLFGDYYQWGRSANFLSGQIDYPAWESESQPNTPANWSNIPHFVPNSWNSKDNIPTSDSDRENDPIKNTGFDPCPTGYRVPTGKEASALLANTTMTRIVGGNYNSAAILTSKRRNDVKMTMINQGEYGTVTKTENSVAIEGRYDKLTDLGSAARYWTSQFEATELPARYSNTFLSLIRISSGGAFIINKGGGESSLSITSIAMPIRCIAEDSSL